MILHRQAREFYTLAIDTTPSVNGGWEASFDNGQTWAAGQTADGAWRWLLAGPGAPADDNVPDAVITRSTAPLVRAVDTPEFVVRQAPTVILV